MEELMNLMYDVGDAFVKKNNGQVMIEQNAAAILVLAKKIEEQTETMKELLNEVVNLTNRR